MARSLLPSIFGDRGQNRPVFQSLNNELDRIFDEFRGTLNNYNDPFELKSKGQLTPKMDISETDDAVQIEAEIPGVDADNLDVTVSNNVLVIKGEKSDEREEKEKDYHLIERSYGSYLRSIPLGFDVTTDDIKADFKDGVLKVTIPKPEEITQQTKKIAINKAA